MRSGSFLLCSFLTLLIAAPVAAVPQVGDSAPAWRGQGADGQSIKFDPGALQKPTVLLFWATWCPYCKRLMPHLQSVLETAGPERLDVYALSFREDDDADPAAALKQRGETFTLVVEADAIADQYGVRGTPVLLLVASDGRVRYLRPNGAAPAEVEAALRKALKLPTAQ